MVKMHFAHQKTINKFANVNQATPAILKSAAKLLIIVKVHLVRPVQHVETIVAHSSVSVSKVSSAIPTIMDVKNQKNVKSTTIVPKRQNVSQKMDLISVKTFVKVFNVDRMQNVSQKITRHNVTVDLVTKEIQKIEQTDVDQNQIHAQPMRNVLKIHIAMELFVSQLVWTTKNAAHKKLV